MKKTFFSFFFTLVSVLLFSQVTVNKEAVVIGKSILTGEPIKAVKYGFGEKIYQVRFDSASQTLSLQIRGLTKSGKYYKNRGRFALLDLNSKKIRWSRKVNYGNIRIEQYDGVLTFNKRREASTTRIDIKTGTELWNTQMVVFATIPNLNIALGYRFKTFRMNGDSPLSRNLSCIDLTTSRYLWRRPVDNTFGWSNVINLNDEDIIVKSSGLYQINLKTGKGWEYSAATGESSFLYEYKGFESNLVSDSLNYFYASKNKLTCLTLDGRVKWEAPLPETTSASSLIADSLNVYLINYGKIERNGEAHYYGEPYVAAFDKMNGRNQYFSFTNFKNNPLITFLHRSDSLDLFFKDRSIRYSLDSGNSRTVLYDTDLGDIEKTAGRFTNYVKRDSVFKNLHDLDSQSLYFYTKNQVVKIDDDLKITPQLDIKDLYFWCDETEKWTLLFRNKIVTAIDENGRAVAELNIGARLFIINDKLYAVKDDSIIEVDLSGYY